MAILMKVISSQHHAITVVATDNTMPYFCLEVDGKRVTIGGNYEFSTADAAADFGEQVSTQFTKEAAGRSTESECLFTIEK